jgi:hypothetical protein
LTSRPTGSPRDLGHFGPVEQQWSKAPLINFVNLDVAHRPHGRHLAHASQQTYLAEAVARRQPTEFLDMTIAIVALTLENARPHDHQG